VHALIELASASELVRRVGLFVEWLGQGRKLTQTGRVTLGDARELVKLLGTGDEIDPKIGDRVYRTKSSEELYGLTLVVAWAKAARLVRVVKGRMVPVKRSAGLHDRPLELVARFWEVFGELGTVICREGWFESPLRYEFRAGLAVLTGALRTGASTVPTGSVPFADLNAAVWDELSRYFVLSDMTESQLSNVRRSNDRDVRQTLEALELLGLVRVADAAAMLTPLGRRVMRGSLDAKPGEPMLRVRIRLLEVVPLVWRRLLVPAGIRLDQLHRVFQAAMGWTDSHLHWFIVGDRRFGVPDPDWPELEVHDERTVTLRDLAALGGGRFRYTYDFGDHWEHELVVEQELTADEDQLSPACLDGVGACPPEDCGGSPGYEHLRQVLADPAADEHHELLTWLGLASPTQFDPAHFDPAEANRALAAL
jgi:hypothetical protein